MKAMKSLFAPSDLDTNITAADLGKNERTPL